MNRNRVKLTDDSEFVFADNKVAQKEYQAVIEQFRQGTRPGLDCSIGPFEEQNSSDTQSGPSEEQNNSHAQISLTHRVLRTTFSSGPITGLLLTDEGPVSREVQYKTMAIVDEWSADKYVYLADQDASEGTWTWKPPPAGTFISDDAFELEEEQNDYTLPRDDEDCEELKKLQRAFPSANFDLLTKWVRSSFQGALTGYLFAKKHSPKSILSRRAEDSQSADPYYEDVLLEVRIGLSLCQDQTKSEGGVEQEQDETTTG